MTTGPKISIVTPAYCSAATIEQTIRSVVNQEYRNFEYLVLDGAGDETYKLLEQYNEEIDWWCSEPDDGQYDAIIKGFSRATGEILCWLNADDQLLPGAFRIVADIFSKFPDVSWISSLAPGSCDATGLYSGYGSISGFSKAAFLDGFFLPGTRRRGNFIQQESTFFRRELFESVPNPFAGCKLAGDFALWCQFYEKSDLIGVTYPIAGFRHIAGQRSEDMSAYMLEARAILNETRQREGHVVGGHFVERLRMLGQIPDVRSRILRRFSYVGQRVSRERYRYPDASWKLETHQFLP